MLEYKTMFFPFNDQLPKTLEELAKQGWINVPGVEPHVTYVVCRPVDPSKRIGPDGKLVEHQGFGTLVLDESKIEVRAPDGSLRPL